MTILIPKSMFLAKVTRFLKDSIIPKILFAVLVITLIWSQTNFVLTEKYIYMNVELPESFVGYKIVHISDICNKNTYNLVSSVKSENPDIIVLSGGFSDVNGNYNTTQSIVQKLSDIAPVYYVYSTNDAKNELSNTQATNIDNISITLEPSTKGISTAKDSVGTVLEVDKSKKVSGNNLANSNSNTITLCGMSTTPFKSLKDANTQVTKLIGTDTKQLTMMILGKNTASDGVAATDIDMIFTGGTFGINPIEINNGTYNKAKEYTSGMYTTHSATIFLSSGIGTYNTSRVFNFPKIQSITLSDGSIQYVSPLEKFLNKFDNSSSTVNEDILNSEK